MTKSNQNSKSQSGPWTISQFRRTQTGIRYELQHEFEPDSNVRGSMYGVSIKEAKAKLAKIIARLNFKNRGGFNNSAITAKSKDRDRD